MLPPLSGHRILVVDDERAIAAAVARRLEQAGAICSTADTGSEGEQMLATGTHSLLISDIRMPGRSGLELLDAAMALTDAPGVILLADPSDISSATEALSRGADCYVHKPVDLELLARHAELVLERHRLLADAAAIETGRAAGPTLLVLGEMVNAAEKADPYRAGFSTRTARIAAALASTLGLNADVLTLAARIHDAGMLAVPTVEQHSGGPMARPAQHLIRVHPTLGARWVERLGADRAIVAAVAAHHERWDGGGYPGGLAGEDIPPLARALGTAAAMAAMSGQRSYREQLGVDAVITQLEKGRLTQFGGPEADAAIDLLMRMPELVG